MSFHACTIIIRSCPYVHLCIHALRHRHDHHSRSRLRLHNMLTYERTYIDTYTCTKMNSIERVCVPYKTKSMHFIKTLKWMHTYILQTSITFNSGYTCKDSLKSNNNECRSFMTLHAYDTFSYVHKMFPG